MNRNCLSYWFPKLQATGVPVPRTEIVHTAVDLTPLCDGKDFEGRCEFVLLLKDAARRVSERGPWFLRTGQGSGKHDWRRTCHVTDLGLILNHVAALVEWSHLVDFFGLPHDVWCAREMLPVEALAVLPRYGDMPLVKEVRAFVEGGKVLCAHPYWPAGAIADGFGMPRDRGDGRVKAAADSTRLAEAFATAIPNAEDRIGWEPLAERVAAAFAGDGSWSVDLLATRSGWFVTDMAEAARSFHWEGCANAGRTWENPPCP